MKIATLYPDRQGMKASLYSQCKLILDVTTGKLPVSHIQKSPVAGRGLFDSCNHLHRFFPLAGRGLN